jgi:hypothetical protein
MSLLSQWRNRHKHTWITLRTKWWKDNTYGDVFTRATQQCTSCKKVRTARYSGHLTTEELNGN